MKTNKRARSRVLIGAALAAVWLSQGCGTHSILRSGDTLARGQVELAGGVAANTLPEVIPVVQAAYGATDRLELVAHYELDNGFAEGRFGVLSSERHGIALAFGLGVGGIDSIGASGAAVTASAVLSKRLPGFELIAGSRTFLVVDGAGDWLTTARIGVSVPLGPQLRFVVEGGAAIHAGETTVGEGAAAIATRF